MLPWGTIVATLLVSMLVVSAILVLRARAIPAARPWVVLTVLGFAAMPVAIVVHNVASAFIQGEEGISFVIALTIAPIGIAVGTLGAGLALLRERRDLGVGIALAGAGMALFGLYSLFALVVTTIEGGNPGYQAPVEMATVPLATLAVAVGAIVSLLTVLRRRPA